MRKNNRTVPKILVTIFLILFLCVDLSMASQILTSKVNETKNGTTFHYKIETPTFWDINQTHNVTVGFEVDAFGEHIEVVEGQVGLMVIDNNKFNQYTGFQDFGPFIKLDSIEDLYRIKQHMANGLIPPILWDILNIQLDSLVFDAFGKVIPMEYKCQFKIDLFLSDLIKDTDPETISFYLSFQFYETTIDHFDPTYNTDDSSTIQKIDWVKVAEYTIDHKKSKRTMLLWFWPVIIVLLVKYSNSRPE